MNDRMENLRACSVSSLEIESFKPKIQTFKSKIIPHFTSKKNFVLFCLTLDFSSHSFYDSKRWIVHSRIFLLRMQAHSRVPHEEK